MLSMPFDQRLTALHDILRHIDLAEQFVAELDRAAFLEDMRTVYAVTRCLEIISEASRRLPDELKARHPSIPWRQMAGAGNVYRHDYEDVAAQLVWETVRLALPPLRSVTEQEIGAAGR
ncbi:MAG TPA: HepT-like ribonuclease domain-containing protein [Propylenella sp.]